MGSIIKSRKGQEAQNKPKPTTAERQEVIMKKFKIDVMWNNNDCLDPDAVQERIEAENCKEAEELAKDHLIECGADEEEIAYIIATEV